MLKLIRRFWQKLPLAAPIFQDIGTPQKRLYTWHNRNLLFQFPLGLRLLVIPLAFLAWFVKAPYLILTLLLRHGRATTKEGGPSLARQTMPLLKLAFLYQCHPGYYYYLQLYKHRHFIPGRNFLMNPHVIPAFSFLGARFEFNPMHDKLAFHHFFKDKPVKALPVLSSVDRHTKNTELATRSLPNKDLFAKPNAGFGGKKCFLILSQGEGVFQVLGKTLATAEVFSFLKSQCDQDTMLIQERLKNHPSIMDLSNGHLATTRIVTVADKKNGINLLFSMFLMPVADRIISNAGAVGLVAAVDIQSGTLQQAIRLKQPFLRRNIHPQGGGTIEGRKLPFWQEACELCCDAHAYVSECPIIGWDIVLSENGPFLLEGNICWSIEAWELTHQKCFTDDDPFLMQLVAMLEKAKN